MTATFDLLIVGGGVNGCGIARDAAGRGLSTLVVEKGDLASATSSGSTKLFHGGLRYLEHFEIKMVREALGEREDLLRAMPHISWPMRFVLPCHPDMRFDSTTPASKLLGFLMPWAKGRRPRLLIRMGLFLYDHLGRKNILPGTSSLKLRDRPEGVPLKDEFTHAYEYSDCWAEDSRLVALNARDAVERGATVRTRTEAIGASVENGVWKVALRDTLTGAESQAEAKLVVNAAGPWAGHVAAESLGSRDGVNLRLVRGSHIVTKRLFDHDKCYFLQGSDGRIVFMIPYETDFTLIGTTDVDHGAADTTPECTDEERDYMIDFVNGYLKNPISADDVVWTYSGVRPLYSDGSGRASEATRDYVLRMDRNMGAPALNIFGGKLTTYRRLAERAVEEVAAELKGASGPWTAGAPLPGGDFPVDGFETLVSELGAAFGFLTDVWARRLVRAYGTDAQAVMGDAASASDLGEDFGATLTQREVEWLMEREFARTAEDVVWRRSKLGLRMTQEQISRLDQWMSQRAGAAGGD